MNGHLNIASRLVGDGYPPLVIAEVGINHEGCVEKAIKIVDDAKKVGCECVKFQCHIIEDEMTSEAKRVVPGNAKEPIWDMMSRCQLSEESDRFLKTYVESKGMIYLSSPFSRAAAERLNRMGVVAFKIGSGECNNYPLIEHIAGYGKPVILSTGMNDIESIKKAVQIFSNNRIPIVLMHCTSIYPTPYSKVRLGALKELRDNFPDLVLGLSDHSIGNYTCYAAVALGASVLEKHFTSDKTWPGSDIPISVDPRELKELIDGSRAIYESLGGGKTILAEEKPTIDFAYASVVTIKEIKKDDVFTINNLWVKRPGTGDVRASRFDSILGMRAARDIPNNTQLMETDMLEKI